MRLTIELSVRLFGFLVAGLLLLSGVILQAQAEVGGLPPETVLDLEWSPDGNWLARVFADGTVQVLSATTQQVVLEFPPTSTPLLLIAQLDWSGDSGRLAWGVGATVTVWNTNSQQVDHSFAIGSANGLANIEGIEMPEGIVSLEWSGDDSMLMALTLSVRLAVFEYPSGNVLFNEVIGSSPSGYDWLPDDSGLTNGSRVLHLAGWEFRQLEVPGGQSRPNDMASSGVIKVDRHGELIATGTVNGYVEIADSYTGEALSRVRVGDTSSNAVAPFVTALAWSADDQQLLVATDKGEVYAVIAATGSVQLVAAVEGTIRAVDVNPVTNDVLIGGVLDDGQTVFDTVELPPPPTNLTGSITLPNRTPGTAAYAVPLTAKLAQDGTTVSTHSPTKDVNGYFTLRICRSGPTCETRAAERLLSPLSPLAWERGSGGEGLV